MKFHEPTTVREAVDLLAADPASRCLAGGASLVALMNARAVVPGALISLRRIAALQGIAQERDGTLRIGAMTTHKSVARCDLFDPGQLVVRRAAAAIGSPAIRNMGTIGGSISHGDPSADYPAPLAVAGAIVEVEGPKGKRDIPATDFFVGINKTALAAGEMVIAVRLPGSPAGSIAAYERFSRVAGEVATATVAVRAVVANGRCTAIRIAVGGCGPRPMRSEPAEQQLLGSTLDRDSIVGAGEMLAQACAPIDDVRGSAAYRRMLVPELLARAMAAVREAAKGRP